LIVAVAQPMARGLAGPDAAMTHAIAAHHAPRSSHRIVALCCVASLGTAVACDPGDTDIEGTTFGTDTAFETDPGADDFATTYAPDTDTDTSDLPGTTGSVDSTDGGDPGDSTGTEGSCLPSGTYLGTLVERVDLYNHFPYLMLWYLPARPDETTEEIIEVQVAADGAVTIDIAPRASAGGSGHAGLAGLTGTLDGDCLLGATDTEVSFESDTGPFGTITVTLQGELPPTGTPTLDLTLQGGGIPSGPITYSIELAPN
jgi:hypothetical protein